MFQPLNTVGTQSIQSLNAVDTTQRHPLGFMVDAYDPYWGPGRFIYAVAGGTINQFGVCALSSVYNSTTKRWDLTANHVANTANLGTSVGVAMLAATVGQFMWIMLQGVTPIKSGASVAADTAFGITAAGTVGANSAGKQILNARIQAAATTTVAKANCVGVSGASVIQVPDSDGWFVGAYLSGTGVGTNAVVTAIATDGRSVTVSVVNSAAISGTVTATYNNATIFYNVAALFQPFAQGAIT